MPDPRSFLPQIPPDRLRYMAQSIEPGPAGIAALLQRPGVREGLLVAGLNMLASDSKRESFGQSLARSASAGIGAGREAAEREEFERVMAGAPKETQAVMRLLGPERGALFLAERMMAPAPEAEYTNVNPGQTVLRNGRPIYTAPSEAEDVPSEIRTFREYLDMTPEERASWLQFRSSQAPNTTVNVGEPQNPWEAAIAAQGARQFNEGFEAAQANVQKLASIDRVLEIVSNESFRSGPLKGSTLGQLSERFADDPTARELMAEFQAIGGQMTMAQLEAFTGPKTDYEYRQAQRLVFNDPTMTPEEIAAGLKVHRGAAQEAAVRWANRIMDTDTSLFDPRNASAQLEAAEEIVRRFGPNSSPGPLTDQQLEENFRRRRGPRNPS